MKTIKLISFTIVLLLSLFNGCAIIDSNINGIDEFNSKKRITGSGNIISTTKNFSNFTDLDIESAFSVRIIKSNIYKVSFEVDDNIAGYLYSYQSGKKVHISLEDDYSFNNVTLRAIIETPNLENVRCNGGTVIQFVNRDFFNNLILDLNSGSVVKGNLDVDSLELRLNGGSIVEFAGAGTNINVFGNGGAILELYDFQTKNCNLNFNGGCIAYLNVTDNLSASLAGGSIVKYKGNPSLGTINISGGSVIQKSN
jgi:hypothetical protein